MKGAREKKTYLEKKKTPLTKFTMYLFWISAVYMINDDNWFEIVVNFIRHANFCNNSIYIFVKKKCIK